jgi:hypothetical protein
MNTYNKFMLYFWLTLSIISFSIVTFKVFTEGFERWIFYFVFPAISLLMFFVRRWMIRRMQQHVEFLNNKEK